MTDGDAHAWVEVYVDGFGWFPVEFTVPDTGAASAGYGDFINALGRLFRPTDMPDAGKDDSTDISTPEFDPAGFLNLKGTPAFVIFIWILVLLMLIPVFKRCYFMLVKYFRQWRSYRKGDYSSSVIFRYENAASRLRRIFRDNRPGLVANTLGLAHEVLNCTVTPGSSIRSRIDERLILKMRKRITEVLDSNNTSLDELCLMTQECFYSDKKPDKQTADLLIRFYKAI